jgi:hypothetical protein
MWSVSIQKSHTFFGEKGEGEIVNNFIKKITLKILILKLY